MDRILADKTYGNSLKNMNSKYFNTFLNGETTWKTLTDNSAGYLSADTNNLYVVDPSHEKAYAYWVSSPSTVNNENIILVYYYGRVRSYYYNNELVAFRPIVCLSSKVTL